MILLDTHIWVWWVNDPDKLDSRVLDYLDNLPPSDIFISIISCWEVAKLVEKKRLQLPEPLSVWFEKAIDSNGLTFIELERIILQDACALPGIFHSDPADQLIVATSRIRKIPLLTADNKILAYEYVPLFQYSG
ncbi:type II toxin-antitoxin system VapC family toxin [Spirosoma migulaei]